MGHEHLGLSAAELEALEDEDLTETPETLEEEEEEEAAAELEAETGAEPGSESEPAADPTPAENLAFTVPTGDLGQLNAAIAELRKQADELEAQYEGGESELSYAELRAQVREINNKLQDLSAEKAEIQAIQKLNAAYEQQWWQREVNAFKREALKADGVNYDGDDKLAKAWDQAVRYLGNDPDNADKDARWFLQEAHELVKARFKLGAQAGPTAPAQPRRSRVDEAIAARRAQAGKAPVTLAHIPAAGVEHEGQGEFSHLDRLSGMDLELALARMPKDQVDRYLAA